MDEVVHLAIEGLKCHYSFEDAIIPEQSGVYAFYLVGKCFEKTLLEKVQIGDCIYIGIAETETIKERVELCHMKDSGFSTLRRSIGAILRRKYNLEPVMRGTTRTDSNIRNFRFSGESEIVLTNLFRNSLELAFYPMKDTENGILRILEKELIKEFKYPAFNLEYGSRNNEYYKAVKAARKDCRDIVSNL